jgi:hypothetical protein
MNDRLGRATEQHSSGAATDTRESFLCEYEKIYLLLADGGWILDPKRRVSACAGPGRFVLGGMKE